MVHIVIKVRNTNSKLNRQSRVISGGNSISKPGLPNAHIMNKKEVTTTTKTRWKGIFKYTNKNITKKFYNQGGRF